MMVNWLLSGGLWPNSLWIPKYVFVVCCVLGDAHRRFCSWPRCWLSALNLNVAMRYWLSLLCYQVCSLFFYYYLSTGTSDVVPQSQTYGFGLTTNGGKQMQRKRYWPYQTEITLHFSTSTTITFKVSTSLLHAVVYWPWDLKICTTGTGLGQTTCQHVHWRRLRTFVLSSNGPWRNLKSPLSRYKTRRNYGSQWDRRSFVGSSCRLHIRRGRRVTTWQ